MLRRHQGHGEGHVPGLRTSRRHRLCMGHVPCTHRDVPSLLALGTLHWDSLSSETPRAQPPGETFGWRQSCYMRRGVGEFSFPLPSSGALIHCSCRGVGSHPELRMAGWAQPLINHKTTQGGAAGSLHSCTSPGKLSLNPAPPWDIRDGILQGGEIPRDAPGAVGR